MTFDDRLARLPAPGRDFGSDNRAPACPAALAALVEASAAPRAGSYGEDPWTARASQALASMFTLRPDALEVLWVPTGTAANVVAVGACRPGPGAAVVCAEDAHVRVDEAGALERAWGTPLVPVASPDGKVRPDALAEVLDALEANFPFSPDPAVLTVAQATESGRVYTLDELSALVGVASARGMATVLDGARFANARAARAELADVFDAGVAAVVVGGTKNGLPSGEAVVVADPAAARAARRAQKQLGHTVSKSRFLAAPAAGCLEAGCFLDHARTANAAARRLADGLGALGVALWRPVEANLVFAHLDDAAAAALDAWCHVSAWAPGVVRLACAWDHTGEDCDRLLAGVAALVA